MAKQHHFVVVYDASTDMFVNDEETLMARFDDGVVWDSDTEEWEEADGINEKADRRALLALNTLLSIYNIKEDK